MFTEQPTQTSDVEQTLFAERARLVRLCARLGGHGAPAEDLAQETLLEAWRARDRLRDPSRPSQWLSGIARNVCLRWRHRQSREPDPSMTSLSPALTIGDVELDIADDIDLEVELERSEVADLLDRALCLLPADARELLVQRYVEDLPIDEMAARRRTTEGAAALRLHRGRRALRRVLTTQLRAEAAALGLLDESIEDWQGTRIWCPYCGDARLQAQRNPAERLFIARCPACGLETSDRTADFLSEVKGYWRTLLRVHQEIDRYYRDALATGGARCCCGRTAPLRFSLPRSITGFDRDLRGVHILCPECGACSIQPDSGLALTHLAVRRFWREHKRIRMTSHQDIVAAGRPAILVRVESVTQAAAVEVVSAADTFEVLAIDLQPHVLGVPA